MKTLLALALLLCHISAGAQPLLRFTGQFFERRGRLYIAQDPKQLGVETYEVTWKKGEKPAHVCRGDVTPFCPRYTLYFDRLAPQGRAPAALVNAYIGTPEDVLFPRKARPKHPTTKK